MGGSSEAPLVKTGISCIISALAGAEFPQARFDPEAPPAAGLFDFATRDDVFRSFLREARWQSGHAAACKAVYAGSIPTLASRTSTDFRDPP
jgi:hypothetical protein